MKKIIMVLVFGILMAGLLTACSFIGIKEPTRPEAAKKNVVILIGNHANAALPNILDLQEKIKEACLTYGSVSIIAVDGNPYLVATVDVPAQKSNLSDEKKEQIAEEQTLQIMYLMEQGSSKTGEVDTLAALQMAARQLEGCDGEKELLVADSGLSTTGLLDFSSLLLESDRSEEIVGFLESESAIPDLSAVSVIWTGMGSTIAPQDNLYEKNRINLCSAWQAVLEASGAKAVTFDMDLSLNKAVSDNILPVTTVPIVKPVSACSNKDILYEEDEIGIWNIDEETVSFKPGSAELRTSKKRVLNVLDKFIAYLKENKDKQIILVGTTASAGTNEELKKLSLERTATIKKIMVEAGLQKSRIVVIGMGYNNLFTQKDTDDEGNLIESIAKQNRSVILMDADSRIAKRLLKGR